MAVHSGQCACPYFVTLNCSASCLDIAWPIVCSYLLAISYKEVTHPYPPHSIEAHSLCTSYSLWHPRTEGRSKLLNLDQKLSIAMVLSTGRSLSCQPSSKSSSFQIIRRLCARAIPSDVLGCPVYPKLCPISM